MSQLRRGYNYHNMPYIKTLWSSLITKTYECNLINFVFYLFHHHVRKLLKLRQNILRTSKFFLCKKLENRYFCHFSKKSINFTYMEWYTRKSCERLLNMKTCESNYYVYSLIHFICNLFWRYIRNLVTIKNGFVNSF